MNSSIFSARRPSFGRTFTAEEDRPRGGNVIVLSNGLWQRRFGSDPGIVGKALTLGGESYTVIGVLAPASLSIPSRISTCHSRPIRTAPTRGTYFRAAARLKPGVSLSAAKAALNLAGEEFKRRYPGAMDRKMSFTVEPMQQLLVRNVRTALYRSAGRGRLRAVDRLRQRRQPAAGARHRFAPARSPSAPPSARAVAASSANC